MIRWQSTPPIFQFPPAGAKSAVHGFPLIGVRFNFPPATAYFPHSPGYFAHTGSMPLALNSSIGASFKYRPSARKYQWRGAKFRAIT